MTESQKLEQTWETPSVEDIPVISRGHVEALEASDDEAIWTPSGQALVLLHTVGRKSKKEHKVPLPTWRDGGGHRIVVASFAGAPQHPAWFLNLRDRVDPEVLVRVRHGRFWSVPEILEDADYEQTWAQLTADRAWYNDYQAKTERRIPLVRLAETRPA
jgi:deazaflavin-dependent oxidoreductase (nitroreductase family)